jgi:hypothetical protein
VVPADHFLGGVTRYPSELGIHVFDRRRAIGNDNGEGALFHRFGQHPQLLGALAGPFFKICFGPQQVLVLLHLAVPLLDLPEQPPFFSESNG